jgi:hypothetical protein
MGYSVPYPNHPLLEYKSRNLPNYGQTDYKFVRNITNITFFERII